MNTLVQRGAIINDCKLSSGSPWTDNQKSELIEIFKNIPDDIQGQPEKAFVKYRVRSQNIDNAPQDFGTTTEIRIYKKDIYKTISNGSGGFGSTSPVTF